MALAKRFEDLWAWQAARALTKSVYGLASNRTLGRDFALNDQIRRAALSTMNNIAEGFDSGSRIEFARFLRYASRSASEVQSCLYVARDRGYVSTNDFDRVYREAAAVRKLCAGLTRSWRASDHRQPGPTVREPAPPPYGREPLAKPALSPPPPPVTGHRSPITFVDPHR